MDLIGPVLDPIGPVGPVGLAAEQRGPGPSGSYLQRYRFALPPGGDTVDLGGSITPTVELRPGVWVKADYEQPSRSFKDRGASVMIGTAASLGVRSVLLDSSGNAGRSVAAHAQRAGMECTVYLPQGTPPAKVAAIAGEGASVVEVPGGRSAAAAAAADAASAPGAPFYASHVYQPAFHHGVKTLAFELYEQVPDLDRGSIIVPVGNGTLVLGLWIGFNDLLAAGRLSRRPAIVGVQADRCAPLVGLPPGGRTWEAAHGGLGRSVADAPVGGGAPAAPPTAAATAMPTAAAGIAIPDPPRAAQIRAATLASGGSLVAVTENDILTARDDLRDRGFPVDPTGGVAWAALNAGLIGAGAGVGVNAGRSGPLVVVLTG